MLCHSNVTLMARSDSVYKQTQALWLHLPTPIYLSTSHSYHHASQSYRILRSVPGDCTSIGLSTSLVSQTEKWYRLMATDLLSSTSGQPGVDLAKPSPPSSLLLQIKKRTPASTSTRSMQMTRSRFHRRSASKLCVFLPHVPLCNSMLIKRQMPTFTAFHKGNKVKEVVGARPPLIQVCLSALCLVGVCLLTYPSLLHRNCSPRLISSSKHRRTRIHKVRLCSI